MKFLENLLFYATGKVIFLTYMKRNMDVFFLLPFFLEMGFDTASNPDKHKKAVNVSHLLPHPT
ncbi:hypothetical protein CHI02_07730 [Niallia circulans]|nr:hypothetical protein CHI02_07730 [Niallia circulans]